MQQQVQPADRFLIREINQSNVLNLIRIHAPVSRPQLATLSGLSLVTIAKITGTLIERGLIIERDYAESTGGRRAGLLGINPEGGFVIGLIPQPESLTAVILNLSGDPICTRQWSIPLYGNDSQAIDLVAQCVEELLAESGIPKDKVIGVGFGMSGFIDAARGYCMDASILGWKNVEISHPLEKRLGVPVFVDNDVNCLTVYEKLFGHGQPYAHFLVIAVGRGIGLGIMANGDLYRGAFGGAGEFGHTVVTTGGRLCECGNHGCLCTYVSFTGIVENYREYSQVATYNLEGGIQEPTFPEILERAQNGDAAAQAALQQAGTLLGISVANLINIFNPECIILSSPDSNILTDNSLIESMHKEIKQHLFLQMGKDLRFYTAKQQGFESWARGAGCLVLRHFFASSARVHPERSFV
jgi:Transcriptional regulator/sugar kinase